MNLADRINAKIKQTGLTIPIRNANGFSYIAEAKMENGNLLVRAYKSRNFWFVGKADDSLRRYRCAVELNSK